MTPLMDRVWRLRDSKVKAHLLRFDCWDTELRPCRMRETGPYQAARGLRR